MKVYDWIKDFFIGLRCFFEGVGEALLLLGAQDVYVINGGPLRCGASSNKRPARGGRQVNRGARPRRNGERRIRNEIEIKEPIKVRAGA